MALRSQDTEDSSREPSGDEDLGPASRDALAMLDPQVSGRDVSFEAVREQLRHGSGRLQRSEEAAPQGAPDPSTRQ